MAKKLLVVDQNLAVHRLLDFTLSKEGFQIVAVEDGLAALDQAYQDAPALIMVNSQLDGLPLSMFVKKVRERETLRTTPIILMAQSNDELNMEQLRRAGITDVVKKPLDAMEINATISRCIPQSAPAPVAQAAVNNRQPAGATAAVAAAPNTSHSGSTEEDQDMVQMEQLLGWVPREQAGPPGKAAAPPPPPRSAPPPPEPQAADAQITNAPFEFELQDPMAEAVAASPAAPPENAIPVQENAISMDDLLIGSDALLYQPPVETAPPPPPPPPEPEPEPESDLPAELQVVMSAKAPIPVKAQTRPAPPKAASPQSSSLGSGGPDEMSREETERLVRATVEELTRKLAQETIERITKELVPELAERAVRAEIDRLKAE